MVDDGQSVSRKRKMDDQSGQDLLSDLPLSIIHCILELVPMIDAVRTCILSKQWRYKWVSLPRLVFDQTIECVDQTKSEDIRITWLKNFITNALFLHQGPIQKFQLSNLILNSCPDTDSWLLHLSRNEIRELCIETLPKNGLFTVHSSIYSCLKLTHLQLFGCELAPPPPTFNGFSCLRSLILLIVKGPSNSAVETLVSNSPLLENLMYSNYLDSSEFRIRAPNLKSFKFGGDCKEIALQAPLVTEVSIILSKVYSRNSSACNYSKFLGGFTNLEKLMCHVFFTKYLSIGIESYDRSLVFHHLKIIKLFHVNCHDVKEIYKSPPPVLLPNTVTEISLGNQLKNLQELDLCRNGIEGNIPSCLAELTSLRVLELHKNNLKGNIPAFLFASLNSLEYVSLSSNGFEGSFSFSSLAKNPNLEVFELVDNDNILNVDTERPPGWIPLFQLKVLSLSNCNFNKPTGAVPSFLLMQHQLRVLNLDNAGRKGDFLNCLLGNNTSLERVSLSNNSLQGTLDLNPNSQNPHLFWLDVSCNHISGEIPLLIGFAIPNLKYLNMSRNALRGPIPHSIGLMRQLVSLDLSNNFLSGEVPASLAINCSKLAFLKLSNNSFQGIFPPQTSNLKDLRTLHLDNNNFTAFAEGVLNSATLSLLDVSQNALSGRIPDWIGNLKYLSTLVLSKNFLQGPVPTSLCNMSYLDLSHNHLGPSFPPCSSLPSLVHLHMQNNNLMGPIPNVLSQAPSLVTLDLSHNKLSGGIPDWFAASLPNLRIILLKGNILDGPIPFSLCDLRNISILDFSYNRLSGAIPFCFSDMLLGRESLFDDGYDVQKHGWSNYGSLKIYSHTNQLSVDPIIESDYYMRDENDLIHFVTKKRDESYEGHILYYMSGLDLSCNKLEGPISPAIGLLSGIHALNLSHNYLTGSIPHSFSNLKQIESLDLSHNMLSGEILTQLLALNFLSVFSVAYNNLSGMTPKMVRQFSTFDASSYEGNPRLHGPPLNNPESCCHTHFSNGGDQDYFWYSFAGSSVMLFLSVCGYFYLNSYHLDTILGVANAQLSKVPYCANFAKLLVRRNDSIRFVLDGPHKSGAPDLTVKSRGWYRFFKPQRSTR